MRQIKVLFVCMGNICRSPTAEGVFLHLLKQKDSLNHFEVDSAGTHAYHVGEPPDSRAQQTARARGIDLSFIRARKFSHSDFEKFDYILAMDESNLADLEQLRPADFAGHLGLFLEFSRQKNYREMPDPYHGGASGFTLVLDLVSLDYSYTLMAAS